MQSTLKLDALLVTSICRQTFLAPFPDVFLDVVELRRGHSSQHEIAAPLGVEPIPDALDVHRLPLSVGLSFRGLLAFCWGLLERRSERLGRVARPFSCQRLASSAYEAWPS